MFAGLVKVMPSMFASTSRVILMLFRLFHHWMHLPFVSHFVLWQMWQHPRPQIWGNEREHGCTEHVCSYMHRWHKLHTLG